MASSGNFAIYNPLDATRRANSTLSVGNTKYTSSNSSNFLQTATFLLPETGKWYWEVRIDTFNDGGMFATALVWENIANATSTTSFSADGFNGWLNASSNASYRINGSSDSTNHGTTAAGDVLSVAYDADTRKVWFAKNNTYNDSGNPASGSNQAMTLTANRRYFPASANGSSAATTINFGQDSTFGGSETAGGNADDNGFGDFAYSPPSGFLALCSANLPISDDIDPAQTDDSFPQKNFNVVTYDSTGSGQSITGVGFQPDLVWVKCRSNDQGNGLFDSTRGTSKVLQSDSQNGENTSSGLTSFDSDGYTMGTYYNQSGRQFVGWCWKANGGTTASNSDGSITTTVQANTKAGFSIMTYTGTGSNATIGHGLSLAPDFVLVKRRSSSQTWAVYHSALGGTYNLVLNGNNSKATGSAFWQNTDTSSSVITVGTEGRVNASGQTYVAYAWHNVKGYSKFGSFEGNSNTDGPFIYTGFRPRLVFCKAADATENWQVRDTARSTYNANSQVRIYWNSSSAEGSASTASPIDFLSNGFKVRGSNTEINSNTIVYGAWGDVSFKYGNTF
jgi:hypothetical protein